ncbi:uncharacterized protein LOC108673228 [Hyalella azteca]|uniref:Uncharacterized protein LOC108673228 n=1 Tax=Hyalella azteca TaxID=294128 RepID=A0A8B7NS27_HYAAZ|nr:uncharacterized protein LOC108673228 [Hyalella azteca]
MMELEDSAKCTPQLVCFSQNHGNNVILLENNTVAYRKASFANALTLSQHPVLPGELFLLEIEQTEPGWTGHMRLGLTQLDPTSQLPLYSLPDLSNREDSWICAITKHHNRLSIRDAGSNNHLSRRRCLGQQSTLLNGANLNSLSDGTSFPEETLSTGSSRHLTIECNGSTSVSGSINGIVSSIASVKAKTDRCEISYEPSSSCTAGSSSCSTVKSKVSSVSLASTAHSSEDHSLSSNHEQKSALDELNDYFVYGNGHVDDDTENDKESDSSSLSSGESATRISNNIKESVRQLLMKLALEENNSAINESSVIPSSDLSANGFDKTTCSKCLLKIANGKDAERTQNEFSDLVASSSFSESHCSQCALFGVGQQSLAVASLLGTRVKSNKCCNSDPCSKSSYDSSTASDDLDKCCVSNQNINEPNSRFFSSRLEDCNDNSLAVSPRSTRLITTSNNLTSQREDCCSNHMHGVVRSEIETASAVENCTVAGGELDAMQDVEYTNGEEGYDEQHHEYVSCLTRLSVGDHHIRTSRGLVPRSVLLPSCFSNSAEGFSGQLPLATDEGSRIGLIYLPQGGDYAEMHYIINGEDQGIFTRLLPYKDAPLYAIVDVYGTTKRVRIIQLYETMSLKMACRSVILQRLVPEDIPLLPLPPQLLQYLLSYDA